MRPKVLRARTVSQVPTCENSGGAKDRKGGHRHACHADSLRWVDESGENRLAWSCRSCARLWLAGWLADLPSEKLLTCACTCTCACACMLLTDRFLRARSARQILWAGGAVVHAAHAAHAAHNAHNAHNLHNAHAAHAAHLSHATHATRAARDAAGPLTPPRTAARCRGLTNSTRVEPSRLGMRRENHPSNCSCVE